MYWIYVTDNKKPKNNHYYWVCEKSFGSTTTIEAYYKNGKWYKDFYNDDFGYDKVNITENVIAWYPVQKPDPIKLPKAEGELFSDFEVNQNGNNKKIVIHVLDEEKMRKLGFTDHREGYWYICKDIKGLSDITFNLSVCKNNPLDYRIDILDENFCQPYDYQAMLSKDKTCKPALTCMKEVEKYMDWLTKEGIVSGHLKGEYI